MKRYAVRTIVAFVYKEGIKIGVTDTIGVVLLGIAEEAHALIGIAHENSGTTAHGYLQYRFALRSR